MLLWEKTVNSDSSNTFRVTCSLRHRGETFPAEKNAEKRRNKSHQLDSHHKHRKLYYCDNELTRPALLLPLS